MEVLHRAERRLRSQAHRADIGSWSRYFAAIVRDCNDEFQRALARDRRDKAEQAERDSDRRQHEAQMAWWRAHPGQWLRDALEVIVHQWAEEDGELLFNGTGPGLGLMACALRRMAEMHCRRAALDIAMGVANDFKRANADRLSNACIAAVIALLERELEGLDISVGDTGEDGNAMLSRMALFDPAPAHERIPA